MCVSYCARRANQKYFTEHSVYLFSRCALIAANSGDKVVACLRAEAPSCARQDIPEVAAVRAVRVHGGQFGRAAAIEMTCKVDDTSQRRRRDACAAEYQPAAQSLALRAVVYGHTAMRISVEREIRSRPTSCRGVGYATLVAGFWLVFARAAAAAAPAGFAEKCPAATTMDGSAAGGDYVGRSRRIDVYASSVSAGGEVNHSKVLEMPIKAGFCGEFTASPAHRHLALTAASSDVAGGDINCVEEIRKAVARSLHQHYLCVRIHGMRQLDIARSFLRTATTGPRLRTAGKLLPETCVGFRAGWQLKFGGEHAQIIFCRRVMKSVYDCDDSSAASRGQFVHRSNRAWGLPGWRGAREVWRQQNQVIGVSTETAIFWTFDARGGNLSNGLRLLSKDRCSDKK